MEKEDQFDPLSLHITIRTNLVSIYLHTIVKQAI